MSIAIPEKGDRRAGAGEPPPAQAISVIVTAMNEEGNLRPAVNAVVGAVTPRFASYEIIIIDDGSQDRTREIAESLRVENPRIRVHSNPRNLGLGCSYRIGIGLATHEHTSWVAGNNLLPQEALERVYSRVGERDMVISYVLRDTRGVARRAMSRAFTRCMNLLFGLHVRYYTGPCVYKSSVGKRITTGGQGSMFVAEILIRLLRSDQSYVEVGLQPVPRSSGTTKTFRPRNVFDVVRSVSHLFWELRVLRHAALSPQSDLDFATYGPGPRSDRTEIRG